MTLTIREPSALDLFTYPDTLTAALKTRSPQRCIAGISLGMCAEGFEPSADPLDEPEAYAVEAINYAASKCDSTAEVMAKAREAAALLNSVVGDGKADEEAVGNG